MNRAPRHKAVMLLAAGVSGPLVTIAGFAAMRHGGTLAVVAAVELRVLWWMVVGYSTRHRYPRTVTEARYAPRR